ncbi:conserved hypothetical protein [Neospora caninum Liverpool]|uniref:Uncharacterized protein n=1 Tax=Neospora caninum (strain Liverpool) TaxID=572307 RepID=F0VQZ5_NEOCL|nr:conserved hypothetical protein [Neospora caninum Liverpool]CBZ56142.1 conserved hypothetical protein [Neospora caninum Liverpool]CEL70898.1 TPA: hypothetical protein BN1204_065680 [Neospora caninum Liverpool]|eukprot:XP_003886168.1 conserved hypothetical protein [Neospora caninum Liverpool]
MRIAFCNIICFVVYSSGAFLLHDGLSPRAASVKGDHTGPQPRGETQGVIMLALPHRHTPDAVGDKARRPKRSERLVQMHFRSTEGTEDRSAMGRCRCLHNQPSYTGNSEPENCADEENRIEAAEQKVQAAHEQLQKHHIGPAQKKAEELRERAEKVSTEAEEERTAEEQEEEHHDHSDAPSSVAVFLGTSVTDTIPDFRLPF